METIKKAILFDEETSAMSTRDGKEFSSVSEMLTWCKENGFEPYFMEPELHNRLKAEADIIPPSGHYAYLVKWFTYLFGLDEGIVRREMGKATYKKWNEKYQQLKQI